jgi:hypothetical protein
MLQRPAAKPGASGSSRHPRAARGQPCGTSRASGATAANTSAASSSPAGSSMSYASVMGPRSNLSILSAGTRTARRTRRWPRSAVSGSIVTSSQPPHRTGQRDDRRHRERDLRRDARLTTLYSDHRSRSRARARTSVVLPPSASKSMRNISSSRTFSRVRSPISCSRVSTRSSSRGRASGRGWPAPGIGSAGCAASPGRTAVDPPCPATIRLRHRLASRSALGLWVDLCLVAEAGDDEQPDRFGPGAPMVSSVGVDSGQQLSQAYLDPTTDFRPTGSPFVR